ncbi:MAG: YgiQ family radical SAM protein, partial [Planctomycetota bacterium]
RPRLFAGITAGNMDSMLNRYTAARKPRSEDRYSPGGIPGLRPERATIAYTTMVKQAFKHLPTVIGGIEASLRRFVHYDHWQRKLRRSILADSKADLLVFGMGERQIRAIAHALAAEAAPDDLHDLPGVCYATTADAVDDTALVLPGWDPLRSAPQTFAHCHELIRREQDPQRGRRLIQDQGWCRVVQNPPAAPLSTAELDAVHALPFTRAAHPDHANAGVPALATVLDSIQTHRGCVGSCAFCAIAAHQGRILSHRSRDGIIAEVTALTHRPGFDGVVDDLGAPTANMYAARCERWRTHGACAERDCLWPEPCPQLTLGTEEHRALLRAACAIPAIKRVFIQSGLRHDLLLAQGPEFLRELLAHHTCGTFKVAPEHADDAVLALMRKPSWQVFRAFLTAFQQARRACGSRTRLRPYLIAGHPGADTAAAQRTAAALHAARVDCDLVQEFTPTPMTEATAMLVAGSDPRSGAPVHVTKGEATVRAQKAAMLAADDRRGRRRGRP